MKRHETAVSDVQSHRFNSRKKKKKTFKIHWSEWLRINEGKMHVHVVHTCMNINIRYGKIMKKFTISAGPVAGIQTQMQHLRYGDNCSSSGHPWNYRVPRPLCSLTLLRTRFSSNHYHSRKPLRRCLAWRALMDECSGRRQTAVSIKNKTAYGTSVVTTF
jgi:hypothetical protein